MITRVTNQMMSDLLTNSMSTVDSQYNNTIEELASGKQVNSPSDNPIGFYQILNYRSGLAQISNYQENVSSNNSWLSATESSLSQVNDILTSIQTTAISQASATATASTRQTAAASLQQQIEQILSLGNSQFGNSYLFAGTSTDTAPFSATARSTTEYTVTPASENTYSSTVDTSGGTYTGTVNNAYVIKIVQGGTLGTATYEVSSDGGKTWGGTQTMPASGSIAVGDGINLTFPAGTFAANDVFTVNAYATGYYNGNGEELSNEVNNGVTSNYSITGEEAFTKTGTDTVDIFTVLNNLQEALTSDNTTGITSSLDDLTTAGDQITRYIAQCGTREDSLNTASSVLTDMNTQLTTDDSNIEDADVAKLETNFQQQQLTLEAIYKTASDVEGMSILNFLQ